jgi:hypothetical protein
VVAEEDEEAEVVAAYAEKRNKKMKNKQKSLLRKILLNESK